MHAEMNSLTVGNRALERLLIVTYRCSGRGTRKSKSLGQEVATVFKCYGKVSVCEDCVRVTSDFPLRNRVRKDKEQNNNSHEDEEEKEKEEGRRKERKKINKVTIVKLEIYV